MSNKSQETQVSRVTQLIRKLTAFVTICLQLISYHRICGKPPFSASAIMYYIVLIFSKQPFIGGIRIFEISYTFVHRMLCDYNFYGEMEM